MRYYFALVIAILLLAVPWFAFTFPDRASSLATYAENAGGQLANAILGIKPKTVADLQADYNATSKLSSAVRVLIVPGHEPDYGGAEFGSLKERDMTVELGQDLQYFLNGNSHYQTFITRDTKDWSPEFASYFQNDWRAIIAWEKASRAEESHLISIGSTSAPSAPSVIHNSVPDDVAIRLYGITKWADENSIDVTVHIHFNDDGVHPGNVAGKYSGFAIYVPAKQYGNSTTTTAVAQAIFNRLSKYTAVSDFPGESNGIVDEPDLIAIGANNTADAASLLIEYSYIYEKQFQDPAIRSMTLKDLAFQTYLGLQDFFDSNNAISLSSSYDTLMLPHTWVAAMTPTHASSEDIVAMQTAFLLDGEYPPQGKSLNDCPRSGSFGPCTKAALAEFQKKYGITGEDGVAGPQTIGELNKLYSIAAQ